jgi:hypothetical protein
MKGFLLFLLDFPTFISNMKPNLAKFFSGIINSRFDNITKPLKETVLGEGHSKNKGHRGG